MNFFKISRYQLQTTGRNISRRFYWKLNLSRARLGSGVRISFPLIIEGKGRLEVGDMAQIGKQVRIGISEGSKMTLGRNVVILDEAQLHAGKDTSYIMSEGSRVLTGSTLRNGRELLLARNSSVSSYCMIFPREAGYDGRFILGEGSNIGDFTTIDTSDDVIIGNHVAVGPNCIFYTHDHDYLSSELAAWKGTIHTGKIVIRDGAWVGARVTILPGVTIGEKAVVAAGSVLTRDVAPGNLVGGIPAKPLK